MTRARATSRRYADRRTHNSQSPPSSLPSPVQFAADQVVIAIDPHKTSWTAVAVDTRLQPLGAVRVPVSKAGYRRLRRFAAAWPQACWASEGARGLGAPLTSRLADDGIPVLDVPAKPARRVRLLSSGHGRKTDEADALSVGCVQSAGSAPLRTLPTPSSLCSRPPQVGRRGTIFNVDGGIMAGAQPAL